MRYEIRRFTNAVDYDAEFWPETPLAEVKAYADSVIAGGNAQRVSVYDGNGTMVLNVPRTLHGA